MSREISTLGGFVSKKKKKTIGELICDVLLCFIIIVFAATGVYRVRDHIRNDQVQNIAAAKDTRHQGYFVIKSDFGTCTAFAIDDEYALTAAHCIKTVPSDIAVWKKQKKEAKKLAKEIRKNIKNSDLPPIELQRLQLKLQNIEYKLNTLKAPVVSKIKILPHNSDITYKAKAYDRYGDVDIAVIKGDFKNFKKLKIANTRFTLKAGARLKACGYARTNIYVCNNVQYISPYGFLLQGMGHLIPGMSGGPTIDENGYVVGVNSSQYQQYSIFGSILGVMP